jgi:hypothetical protein
LAVAVQSTESSDSGSGSGTHAVNFPSGLSQGDVVIAVIAADGTGTVTFPDSGWTSLYTDAQNAVRLSIGMYDAPASPGSTFNISLGANEPWRSCSYRISGAEATDGSYPPEVSTGANNLFIGCCAVDRRTITGFPANCPDSNINNDSGSSQEASAGMASDILTQDTFDPGTFACLSDGWVAATVVVFPKQPVKLSNTTEGLLDTDTLVKPASGNPKVKAKLSAEDIGGIQETDQITTADLVIVPSGETKYLTATLTDTDTLPTATLDGTYDLTNTGTPVSDTDTLNTPALDATHDLALATPIPDTDSLPTATLDGTYDLTLAAPIADTDTWTAPALDLIHDLTNVGTPIADTDTLPTATLDGVYRLAKALDESDTLTTVALDLLADLAETIPDTDTITAADLVIVGAVVLLTASLTDTDTLSGADLTHYRKLADTITESDTLSQAALDLTATLAETVPDTDTLTTAALLLFKKLSDTITETDTITTAALTNPVLLSATIPEGAGGTGGGPYATGIITG